MSSTTRKRGDKPDARRLNLHGDTRRCERKDVKFVEAFGEVSVTVTLGFYLEDHELRALGIDGAVEVLGKGELRANLGRYDLRIETNVATIDAPGTMLDKPKIEAEELRRPALPGQIALPGMEYPTRILFTATIPLIGDCRNQAWGLLVDSTPRVSFRDPARAEEGQGAIERAAANFRETMAHIAGEGGSVEISGPGMAPVRIEGRGPGPTAAEEAGA